LGVYGSAIYRRDKEVVGVFFVLRAPLQATFITHVDPEGYAADDKETKEVAGRCSDAEDVWDRKIRRSCCSMKKSHQGNERKQLIEQMPAPNFPEQGSEDNVRMTMF
jgi:hypothetical protein